MKTKQQTQKSAAKKIDKAVILLLSAYNELDSMKEKDYNVTITKRSVARISGSLVSLSHNLW